MGDLGTQAPIEAIYTERNQAVAVLVAMARDEANDLRFDVEWHCPECGHEAREENVPAPGVSWAHCPVCGGRMYARLTQHNLAIESEEGGGDGA